MKDPKRNTHRRPKVKRMRSRNSLIFQIFLSVSINLFMVGSLAKAPLGLVGGLRTLTTKLGLTFSAADFKTCPKTERFLFLEVNSGPMFAAFNAADEGRLNAAIIGYLTGSRS